MKKLFGAAFAALLLLFPAGARADTPAPPDVADAIAHAKAVEAAGPREPTRAQVEAAQTAKAAEDDAKVVRLTMGELKALVASQVADAMIQVTVRGTAAAAELIACKAHVLAQAASDKLYSQVGAKGE
jgi:hypothetical protein